VRSGGDPLHVGVAAFFFEDFPQDAFSFEYINASLLTAPKIWMRYPVASIYFNKASSRPKPSYFAWPIRTMPL
jgi:hypothetical protein